MLWLTVVCLPRPDRYRGRVPLPSLGRLSSRANLKAVASGRHRTIGKTADDELVEDKELTSYLAALAPDSGPESTGTGNRFGDAQVYQLRLNLIASQQLKDLANERDLSPQALAQEWLLERLSWEGQAGSAQYRREAEAHTDEYHFPQGAFDQQVAR
ncbi:hypothetical protein ATK36_2935 [Amycolatopsis sulphurea]|uniref:Uncharacterized protein n=1 Tax=Amycolatopsis sulphurea TaxID=76022 RepID=A0A2A9FBS8_9PSEU|nr:hypothetical protein ATK36_2935 [Amycolatopsis sulphurea]